MKIGYLTQTLDTGTGGGRFAFNLIDGIKKKGFEVVILKETDDDTEGIPMLRRGYKIFSNINEIRHTLRDCDIIHALDGYPYGIIAWIVNMKLNKKLFISAQGTYSIAPLYNWKTSFFLKRAYRAAHKVIAISQFTRDEILRKIDLKNIIIIKHGIEKKNLPDHIIKKSERYLLSVGGIKERKGYNVSIEAFGLIKDVFPDLQYIIVGDRDAAWQTVLDKIIDKYSLRERVIFKENISDDLLQILYRNASLFILTPINTQSHHIEGFGLVYLEAARAGVPVIGTIGTGAVDAINNGKNGILVPQLDIVETSKGISSILSDHALQLSMSLESSKWAAMNSIEGQISNFIQEYTN
ncbi:N/A [soil metagenome]